MKECLLEKLTTADPGKSESHAYYREGQNSMIRAIFNNIKLYEDVINKNNNSGE